VALADAPIVVICRLRRGGKLANLAKTIMAEIMADRQGRTGKKGKERVGSEFGSD
jgi:hypothetical protein